MEAKGKMEKYNREVKKPTGLCFFRKSIYSREMRVSHELAIIGGSLETLLRMWLRDQTQFKPFSPSTPMILIILSKLTELCKTIFESLCLKDKNRNKINKNRGWRCSSVIEHRPRERLGLQLRGGAWAQNTQSPMFDTQNGKERTVKQKMKLGLIFRKVSPREPIQRRHCQWEKAVVTCLVAIVILRTAHTVIAAHVLASCGFLHLARAAFLGAFRQNLLQYKKERKKSK